MWVLNYCYIILFWNFVLSQICFVPTCALPISDTIIVAGAKPNRQISKPRLYAKICFSSIICCHASSIIPISKITTTLSLFSYFRNTKQYHKTFKAHKIGMIRLFYVIIIRSPPTQASSKYFIKKVSCKHLVV